MAVFLNSKTCCSYLTINQGIYQNGVEKCNCEICDLEFESLEALKDHKWEHQDGSFKCCPHCDYKHESLYLLKCHLESKHSEKYEKKYSCEVCEKTFAFEITCNKHKRKTHPKGNQEHVCHICGHSAHSKIAYFQ